MKKNAILIAGILCVAGASRAQDDASERNKLGQYDASVESASHHDDISADSSKRGGSLDARGYDQGANNDEIEGVPDPINPGKQADSSIRGGSIFAREKEWNHDMEPSSGRLDHKRYMKADSSIRGGSMEARGAREARMYRDQTGPSYRYDVHHNWDHSTTGGSVTVKSDSQADSVTSSPNWNPSDDLLRDGLDVEAQSTIERNNDASVGGAAKSESGSATLEDVELEYSPVTPQSESSTIKHELNSNDQLDKNVSGELDIHSSETTPDLGSSELKIETTDPNSVDTFDSSVNSSRPTEIVHEQGDIPVSTGSDLSSDIERENREAVGAAAISESGSLSSSDSTDSHSSFESKDPALKNADTPLKEGDIDFIYRDNRAHGVGSLSTGEFSAAAAAQSGTVLGSNERLSQEIKGRLTRESTGVNATMRSDVARNVQVSANNGEVTLTGTVPSEKDKQMIEMRAAEMPGVRMVKNELTVTPEADAGLRNLERGRNLEDRTSNLQD